MEKDITLEFTTDGSKRLQKLEGDYISAIESVIKERKYVPGQTVIEVTASDVEVAASLLRRGFLPKTSKYAFLSTALNLYLILGSIMIIGGFSYPILAELYYHSRLQFIMVMTGVLTVLTSILLMKFIQVKESRNDILRGAYEKYYIDENEIYNYSFRKR
jgi:cytochrome c biogenesis protein CcdA